MAPPHRCSRREWAKDDHRQRRWVDWCQKYPSALKSTSTKNIISAYIPGEVYTSLKIILATNRSTFLSKTIAIPHETLDRVHCKAVAWRHSINTPSLGDTSVSSSLCVDCFRLADSGEYVAVDCWDFDSLKELDLALFSPPVACSLYKWNSLFSFRSLWRRSIGTIYTIELLKRCQCVELAPWRQIDGLLRILGSPDLDDYIPKPLNKKSHWSNVPRWSL